MPKPLGVRALLNRDGYVIVPGVFDRGAITRLINLLPDLGDAAGSRRLLELNWAKELADSPEIRSLVDKAYGRSGLSPTRAILFDKSPSANWVLGWHQDQMMAMEDQIDERGFSQWTQKKGIWHCRPPKRIQEQAIAVRINLDDCSPANGPLRVLTGTHKDGYRSKPTPDELEREKTLICKAGDVILMKPLVFHASSKAESPTHRRVIHIEYSAMLEIAVLGLRSALKHLVAQKL